MKFTPMEAIMFLIVGFAFGYFFSVLIRWIGEEGYHEIMEAERKVKRKLKSDTLLDEKMWFNDTVEK